METKEDFLNIIDNLQDVYGGFKLKTEVRKTSIERACEILVQNGFDPFKYAEEHNITIPEEHVIIADGGEDPDAFFDSDSDEPELNEEFISQQAKIMEQKREFIRKNGFVSSQTKHSDLNVVVSDNAYNDLLNIRKEKLAKLKELGFSYTVKPSVLEEV